jgi:hypothetical protein
VSVRNANLLFKQIWGKSNLRQSKVSLAAGLEKSGCLVLCQSAAADGSGPHSDKTTSLDLVTKMGARQLAKKETSAPR